MANSYKIIDEKNGKEQCTVWYLEAVLNQHFV